MTAAEAARALGVTTPTLYAYVSRGYIRSEPLPGAAPARRYSRDDVERQRRRTEERRQPEAAAAHALRWGLPILESSITLIADNTLYYRGHDARDLARGRSVAEVASLVWTGRFDASFLPPRVPLPRVPRGLPFVPAAQAALAAAAARDPLAFDLRPPAIAAAGWRILWLLTGLVGSSRGGRVSPGRHRAETIEEALARHWRVRDRSDLLRAALILCADHELNVSAFAARCVASAGASPYGVVLAGLAALEGTRHGGLSARVEAQLASLRRAPSVRRALAERLRRGEALDGFGHPLYRDGDPRAAALLRLLSRRCGRSTEFAFVRDVSAAAASLTGERPTIDFALGALARVLRLPAGSSLTIFAIGRTIGWIGHALEQYATGQIIRPRARYTGPPPVPTARDARPVRHSARGAKMPPGSDRTHR